MGLDLGIGAWSVDLGPPTVDSPVRTYIDSSFFAVPSGVSLSTMPLRGVPTAGERRLGLNFVEDRFRGGLASGLEMNDAD